MKKIQRFRIVIALTSWIVLFALYSQRINLSIAIIGMTKGRVSSLSNDTRCPRAQSSTNSQVEEFTEKFAWDESQQNYLLFAYNIGYLVAHIPGSLLSIKFGLRRVMMVCLFFSTLLTFASICAAKSFWIFFAVRVLIGLANGSLYPIIHETIANYAPTEERTRFAMLTHTGNIMSLVFIFPTGGKLIEEYVNGWKYIFYMTGGLGVISFILWSLFVYSEPSENPWMSVNEKQYIIQSIYPEGEPPKKRISNIPFASILKSPHIYILSCVHFGKLFILYMNLFGLVKYLYTNFGLSRSMAGNLAVIPFIADFLFQLVYPKIVDIMKRRNMGMTSIRKLNTFIGAIGCSGFLIAAGFVPCTQVVVGIILLSLSLLFLPPYQAGYFTAIIEIAPQYCGINMAIINVSGSLAGVVQRYITAALISTIPNIREAYKYSFIITAIVSLLLSLVYVVFGTAERQPWAITDSSKQTRDVKTKTYEQLEQEDSGARA